LSPFRTNSYFCGGIDVRFNVKTYPSTASNLLGISCALVTIVFIDRESGSKSIVKSGAVPGSTSLPGEAGPYTKADIVPGIAEEKGLSGSFVVVKTREFEIWTVNTMYDASGATSTDANPSKFEQGPYPHCGVVTCWPTVSHAVNVGHVEHCTISTQRTIKRTARASLTPLLDSELHGNIFKASMTAAIASWFKLTDSSSNPKLTLPGYRSGPAN
jgi:hypothetical protein